MLVRQLWSQVCNVLDLKWKRFIFSPVSQQSRAELFQSFITQKGITQSSRPALEKEGVKLKSRDWHFAWPWLKGAAGTHHLCQELQMGSSGASLVFRVSHKVITVTKLNFNKLGFLETLLILSFNLQNPIAVTAGKNPAVVRARVLARFLIYPSSAWFPSVCFERGEESNACRHQSTSVSGGPNHFRGSCYSSWRSTNEDCCWERGSGQVAHVLPE